MIKLIASNQAEVIEITRALVQAANSVKLDPLLHEIEQTSLTNTLYRIRDSVEIEEQK